MNRPQKVKEVYQELRMMLGDEYPAHELLGSAALLIEVIEEDDSKPEKKRQEPWVQIYVKPIDKIIAEDSWKNLSHEYWWLQKIGEDDVMSLQAQSQLKDHGLEIHGLEIAV